ncbi:hypothetical protein EJB05_51924, partial [Eragrostis curvula]
MQMVKECGGGLQARCKQLKDDWILLRGSMQSSPKTMDLNMEDAGRQGLEGLSLLAELSQQAAMLGEMGNHYTKQYLHKEGENEETMNTICTRIADALLPNKNIIGLQQLIHQDSEVSGRDEAGPLRRHRLNFESTRVEQLREE